jgi:hypothetical protein
VISPRKAGPPARIVLRVVGEEGWKRWSEDTAFRAEAVREIVERNGFALAVLPPRGIGPTRFAAGPGPLSKEESVRENQVRRRFLVLGRTLEETRVHDARRAVRALAGDPDLSRAPLWLEAEGEMAAVALYAGLFEEQVSGFELKSLPSTHRKGPPLLNVLRVLDLPQAAALVFPRPVRLTDVKPEDFEWTRRAAAVFTAENGAGPLTIDAP